MAKKESNFKTAEVTAGVLILLIGVVVFTTALTGSLTGASLASASNTLTGNSIKSVTGNFLVIGASCYKDSDCASNFCYTADPAYPGKCVTTNLAIGSSCPYGNKQCNSQICRNGVCDLGSPRPLCEERRVPNDKTASQVCASIFDSSGHPYACSTIFRDTTFVYYASTDRTCVREQLNNTISNPIGSGIAEGLSCESYGYGLTAPRNREYCWSNSQSAEPSFGDFKLYESLRTLCCKVG